MEVKQNIMSYRSLFKELDGGNMAKIMPELEEEID